MKTKSGIFSAASLLLAAGMSLSLHGQQVGLWQLNGNYNSANGGEAMKEFFISGEFGTTESFAIGAINGDVAQVLKFPVNTEEDTGFMIPVPDALNDSNDYTFMADLYYPAASNGSDRGLADLSADYAGAELGIGSNNAVNAGGSSGEIIADTWQRVIIVVDGSNEVISRYVDGVLTGSTPFPGAELPFGRYTLSSQLDIIGFAFTSEGYANSVSLREGAISHGHAVALGKASAEGLPAQLPEVPSYVASWIPAGNVADRATDIGAVLDAGDAVVDQASIKLSLDGEAQNAQVSKSGSQFTISVDRSLPFAPGTKHTLTLSYADNKQGAQTYEHEFDDFQHDWPFAFDGRQSGRHIMNQCLPCAANLYTTQLLFLTYRR
jgi:hypothetical protein